MNIRNDSFSLIWPNQQEYKVTKLNENSINNLSIDFLCGKLTNDEKEQAWIKNIFTTVCNDEEVIKYRTDIFEDLINAPELARNLENQLDGLNYLNQITFIERGHEASSIWQLIFRLRELDSYSECLSSIIDAFKQEQIKSKGLTKLRDMALKAYRDNGFEYLSQDVKSLNDKIGKIKSLSLGVNLDQNLNPTDVTLISVNENVFHNSTFLQKFLSFTKFMSKNASAIDIDYNGEFDGITHLNNATKKEAHSLMNKMTKHVEEILKPTINDLKNTLNKYINANINFLTNLIPELTYYLRFTKIVKAVQALGLPMCRSEIYDMDNLNPLLQQVTQRDYILQRML